jgi:hypothetical protein
MRTCLRMTAPKRLIVCWLAAAVGMVAAPPAWSQGNGQGTAPVQANLSLSNRAFMEGEPIVLNFEVINASQQEAHFVLGAFQKQWLTMRLEDSTGTPVPTRPGPKGFEPRYSGAAATGNIMLQAGSRRKGSLFLSRWFAPLAPGTYSLKIGVQLPYALGEIGDTDPYGRARNKESVLSKQLTLALTVTEATLRQVQRTAASLKEAVIEAALLRDQGQENEAIDNQWEDGLEALFSMPPAVAHSSQRSLITDPRLSERNLKMIYNRLASYGSASVADFLAAAAWRYRHRAARNALLVMHALFANEAVKERIKQMFADHKDTMTGMVINLG